MNPVEINALINMRPTVLQVEDISKLESLVMESKGIPKVVDASVFDDFSDNQRMLLMVKHGLYVFPTTELAEWLGSHTFARKVIEVGAGNGAMANHLGVVATDNYSQAPDYRPEPNLRNLWIQGRQAMERMGQAFVTYGANVNRVEAIDAVIKYRPELVYGCFITHKYRAGDKDGNKFGVDEEKLIRRCDYIMIGNAKTHQNKRILSLPHEEFIVPGVVTRCQDQSLNRIWMWRKTR
ncbi:MAG: hypothetical protein ACRDCE_17425 [Cetobacterium sp.]|uniref:hypothetical protein n=1 Tax=Cetobacterium sp. TaxID=2071632 RepID=UPI003EE5E66E